MFFHSLQEFTVSRILFARIRVLKDNRISDQMVFQIFKLFPGFWRQPNLKNMGTQRTQQEMTLTEAASTLTIKWCPGWESNPHEEKSPEDFKSSASAIPPPGQCHFQSNESSASPQQRSLCVDCSRADWTSGLCDAD